MDSVDRVDTTGSSDGITLLGGGKDGATDTYVCTQCRHAPDAGPDAGCVPFPCYI
jgi:hypothetical protein